MRDNRVVKSSERFVPVFIDTLKNIPQTERFQERVGSYPVIRVHNLQGEDIGGRLDTNPTAGITSATDLIKQMDGALRQFRK